MVQKKASLVCLLLSATNHAHSCSFKEFQWSWNGNLAEFGVSRRMDNSVLGKVSYVSFQNPAFWGLLNIVELNILLSFYSASCYL